MIRGLISMTEDKTKMQNYYEVTTEFLKFLGLNSIKDMPEYERLHKVENLETYLAQTELVK